MSSSEIQKHAALTAHHESTGDLKKAAEHAAEFVEKLDEADARSTSGERERQFTRLGPARVTFPGAFHHPRIKPNVFANGAMTGPGDFKRGLEAAKKFSATFWPSRDSWDLAGYIMHVAAHRLRCKTHVVVGDHTPEPRLPHEGEFATLRWSSGEPADIGGSYTRFGPSDAPRWLCLYPSHGKVAR